MSGWSLADMAVRRVGKRIVNGVVERHTGISDVTGTLGTVGEMVIPPIAEAYRGNPNESWVWRWERRLRWTAGLAAGAATIAGLAWIGWRFLRPEKPTE
jgi:hypothetical protein